MFKPIFLLCILLSTAQATPTPIKRACTTAAPSVIDVLRVSTPANPSPGQQFTLSRSGSPVNNTQVSALTFTVPHGSTGCMLQIRIPPLAQSNQIAEGDTQADIWTTSPWGYHNLPTWNNPPQKREMVSTFIFPTGQTSQPFQTVLASNVCSGTMSFLVELSSWQAGGGSVNFQNSLSGEEAVGFSLVYNC